MTIPCRCFNRIHGVTCFTRKSLAKHPDDYAAVRYQPRCPSCGARQWHVDKHRVRVEMARGKSCDCGGYWFVHRRGSRMCHHHPNAERHQSERYA